MNVPEPRKLKSGTWFIQLRLDGHSIPISADSKKECIRLAELRKAEHRAGKRTHIKAEDKTITELMDTYIDSIRKTASPSTIRGYATIRRNRFSSIASTPVSKVKNWQKVIDGEAQTVSVKTLKSSWSFLCTSMRHAKIAVPDVRLPQSVPHDAKWLEPDEVLKLVDLLHGKSFEIPALLALHGLRRSEILAMTYGKIDLKKKLIHVQGAAVLNEDGELILKQTNKNTSSRRTIPIMIPSLSDALLALPERPQDARIVETNVNTLYSQVNALCRANNLPEVGVHGLRHSFASLAFHLGLSEQATMELGGWSDYQTMRKIYTHLAQADRLKSENKITAFFSSASE